MLLIAEAFIVEKSLRTGSPDFIAFLPVVYDIFREETVLNELDREFHFALERIDRAGTDRNRSGDELAVDLLANDNILACTEESRLCSVFLLHLIRLDAFAPVDDFFDHEKLLVRVTLRGLLVAFESGCCSGR